MVQPKLDPYELLEENRRMAHAYIIPFLFGKAQQKITYHYMVVMPKRAKADICKIFGDGSFLM